MNTNTHPLLLEWINKTLLTPLMLCQNPEAIDYLEQHKILIDYNWLTLNTNPKVVDLLREAIRVDKESIDWGWLCGNSSCMELILENQDKINWDRLSVNSHPIALELLKSNINRIYLPFLAMNKNPDAIWVLKELLSEKLVGSIDWTFIWDSLSANSSAVFLLQENMDKIDWSYLCLNESAFAIDLLKDNIDKIDWTFLSQNSYAIDLLMENFDKIIWDTFSLNTNAIDVLKQNQNKINWEYLSKNPSIFCSYYACNSEYVLK